QDERGQKVLRDGEEAADDFAGARGALLQLADLPFAEREKGGLGQRKEETGAGESDQRDECKNRRHWRFKSIARDLPYPIGRWLTSAKGGNGGLPRRNARGELLGSLLSPALPSTSVWRGGRRGG